MRHFINYISKTKGLSAATCRAYAQDVRDFLAWTREIDARMTLSDITRNFIISYTIDIAERYTPATRQRKISAIRQFFGYKRQAGEITDNVAKFVSSPKVANDLPKCVNYDDALSIILGCQIPIIKAAGLLMLTSGLRISEVLALDVRNVNRYERTINIVGKGVKGRIVAYNEDCRDALNELYRLQPCCKPFADIDERQLRHTIFKMVGCTPHALRHTFATHLLNEGMPITTIQMLLGHADCKTTQRYAKVASATMQRDYLAVMG